MGTKIGLISAADQSYRYRNSCYVSGNILYSPRLGTIPLEKYRDL